MPYAFVRGERWKDIKKPGTQNIDARLYFGYKKVVRRDTSEP
jgi:hypothetical protein